MSGPDDQLLGQVQLLGQISERLLEEEDVLVAIAFGSAAANGLRPDSDLDIAVLASQPESAWSGATALRSRASFEDAARYRGFPAVSGTHPAGASCLMDRLILTEKLEALRRCVRRVEGKRVNNRMASRLARLRSLGELP